MTLHWILSDNRSEKSVSFFLLILAAEFSSLLVYLICLCREIPNLPHFSSAHLALINYFYREMNQPWLHRFLDVFLILKIWVLSNGLNLTFTSKLVLMTMWENKISFFFLCLFYTFSPLLPRYSFLMNDKKKHHKVCLQI